MAGEVCDDVNLNPGDGCGATCRVEAGWTCVWDVSGTRSFCNYCGNGIIELLEDCDDGNRVDGDGCPADCMN